MWYFEHEKSHVTLLTHKSCNINAAPGLVLEGQKHLHQSLTRCACIKMRYIFLDWIVMMPWLIIYSCVYWSLLPLAILLVITTPLPFYSLIFCNSVFINITSLLKDPQQNKYDACPFSLLLAHYMPKVWI